MSTATANPHVNPCLTDLAKLWDYLCSLSSEQREAIAGMAMYGMQMCSMADEV